MNIEIENIYNDLLRLRTFVAETNWSKGITRRDGQAIGHVQNEIQRLANRLYQANQNGAGADTSGTPQYVNRPVLHDHA